MAAPVHSIQVALNWHETAIEKDNLLDWVQSHYTKNSFYKQSKYKKSQEITNLCLASRALRGEPQKEWGGPRAAPPKKGEKTQKQTS